MSKHIFSVFFVSAAIFLFSSGIALAADEAVNHPVLSCADNDACSATVYQGEQFSIIVAANPSTGFSWTLDYDKSYLSLDSVNSASLCPSVTNSDNTIMMMVGCGSNDTYNFTALKAGTVKLTMIYSRVWESVQPVTQKVFNITISGDKTDGVCGSVGDTVSTSTLCKAGSVSGFTSADNSYAWTCAGLNGGSSVACKGEESSGGTACIQVITPAKDPLTGICVEYPTPCDVPSSWTKVDSCSESSSFSQTLGPITIDKPLSEMSTDELLQVLIKLIISMIGGK